MKLFSKILIPVAAFGAVVSGRAMTHVVPCPFCHLTVVQATEKQDNEVVLRYGKKKIEYRCVFCALADSGRYEGDLVVYAPSETQGKPVLLMRKAGKWSAVQSNGTDLTPETGVVFLNAFKNHAGCAMLSRAFHTQDGLAAYARENGVTEPKPLALDEMVSVALKAKGGDSK